MLEWTGERFIPGSGSAEMAYEHYVRYLFASQLASGKRALDLGCGEGYGAALLSRVAQCVVGVDIAEPAIVHARQEYPLQNLDFCMGSVADLPFTGKYDLITCFETIEHLDENTQHRLLREVKRLLANDGIFLVSTPNQPVYQEAGGGKDYRNPYHIHEMTFPEFRILLEQYFGNVFWYYQNFLTGNCLHTFPVNGMQALGKSVLEVDAIPGEGLGTGLLSMEAQGKYFVAVCADKSNGLDPIKLPSDLALVDRGSRILADWRSSWGKWSADLLQSVTEREQALQEREQAVTTITNSTSWKFVQSLVRVRLRVAPHGSRREGLLRLGGRMLGI